MKGADTCKQLDYTFTRHFAVGMHRSLLCVHFCTRRLQASRQMNWQVVQAVWDIQRRTQPCGSAPVENDVFL